MKNFHKNSVVCLVICLTLSFTQNFSLQYQTNKWWEERRISQISVGYLLIQYQIIWANIIRVVWQTVRRNTTEILIVKGLTNVFTSWICWSRPPMSLYCSVGLSSTSMAFTRESYLESTQSPIHKFLSRKQYLSLDFLT